MIYLNQLYKQHIEGTEEKAIVAYRVVLLCNLTEAVRKGLGFKTIKVYVNTRVLKHLYDRKPAEEFHFLRNNLHQIVKYPDKVYENKGGKRGSYCLVKKIKQKDYLCSIEISIPSIPEDSEEISIVTAFRIRDANYLKDYKLLWSWEDGEPPS